jgi:cryptochrome
MSKEKNPNTHISHEKVMVAVHWFRKGLRLHDNPALFEAFTHASIVYPVFVIDPWFANPQKIGVNRYSFLLQSLTNLDMNLRSLNSRLYVVRGRPEEQIPRVVSLWGAKLLTFEKDSEPYALHRDKIIIEDLKQKGIRISLWSSHTLFDLERYRLFRTEQVCTFASFCKLFSSFGKPRKPLSSITSKDITPNLTEAKVEEETDTYAIPSLHEMGYHTQPTTPFVGGESEALKRLQITVQNRQKWVCNFEKPKTSPNSLSPSTTVLSPYLKFGCLSVSLLYYELEAIYKTDSSHSKPPVSLQSQLLWREFFYYSSFVTPNFDKMIGNPHCRQIPWGLNEKYYLAFKHGQTGYPFIDAIMIQLKLEGWIHHLARHAVACFFTRGDLWQHWEKGAEIFDLYLLDSDWALNNANWQWLSCSNFFYQYFRCYSPISFGQKTDPNGDYIRKYLPQLAKFPTKYIYQPWNAPLSIQHSSGCLIGKDYPHPIVEHDVVVAENKMKMSEAYQQYQNEEEREVKKEKKRKANITPKPTQKKVKQK